MATFKTNDSVKTNLLVKDTLVGVKSGSHMESLVAQTAGLQLKSPVMDGVLEDTLQGIGHKETSELSKAKQPKPRTVPKRMGQIPYSGPKY